MTLLEPCTQQGSSGTDGAAPSRPLTSPAERDIAHGYAMPHSA
jgi:hypothetical protein